MKNSIIVAIFLIFAGISFLSCTKGTDFSKGTTVAAKWSDNNYYLATISEIKDGKYSVDYADGTKGEVTEDDLKALTPKEEIKAGDKVLAVWAGAKFYSGKILELNEKNALIMWDDGSAQSEVDINKILKLNQE